MRPAAMLALIRIAGANVLEEKQGRGKPLPQTYTFASIFLLYVLELPGPYRAGMDRAGGLTSGD
jgi:hypothetical protein